MTHSEDLAAIAAVIHRYSRAMDCREWQLMEQVFVEDATATFNDTTFLRGRAQVVGLIRAAIECCSITHHMNTNIEAVIEGDTARVRNLFRAWHRGAAERTHISFEALGSYEDEFVRTRAGWRIRHRAERSPIEFGDGAALFGEAIQSFLESWSGAALAANPVRGQAPSYCPEISSNKFNWLEHRWNFPSVSAISASS